MEVLDLIQSPFQGSGGDVMGVGCATPRRNWIVWSCGHPHFNQQVGLREPIKLAKGQGRQEGGRILSNRIALGASDDPFKKLRCLFLVTQRQTALSFRVVLDPLIDVIGLPDTEMFGPETGLLHEGQCGLCFIAAEGGQG